MRQQTPYPGGKNAQVPTEVEEDIYDDVWPVRVSSSARPYQKLQNELPYLPITNTAAASPVSPIPKRRSAPQEGQQALINNVPCVFSQGKWHRLQMHNATPPPVQRQTEQPEAIQLTHTRHRSPLLWIVLIAILVMLIGYIALTMLVTWFNVTLDDIHYGRPRTFQTDVRVGHGDSLIPSHFIALNIDHRAQIIECPGSDCSKAIIYLGPQIIGQGDDLAVITLTFKDVNGDGKVDMLVHINDQTYVFINDNGKFRPARPGENVNV